MLKALLSQLPPRLVNVRRAMQRPLQGREQLVYTAQYFFGDLLVAVGREMNSVIYVVVPMNEGVRVWTLSDLII